MAQIFKNKDSITGITAKLMDLILRMSVEQRQRLLSDLTERQSVNWRKHDRKEFLINVHYMANDQIYNGLISNISSGGVFIKCSRNTMQKLNTGKPVTLTFDHPDKKIHIKITGEIARIEDIGFGVNFDNLLNGLITPVLTECA
jgi:hypothetical protein